MLCALSNVVAWSQQRRWRSHRRAVWRMLMTHSSTPQRAMRFCSPWTPLWTLKKKNANLGAIRRLQLWKRRKKKKKENKLLLITVPPHFCHFIFIIRSCLFPPPRHHALEVSHRSDLLVLSHPSSSLASSPLSQTWSLEEFKFCLSSNCPYLPMTPLSSQQVNCQFKTQKRATDIHRCSCLNA